MSSPENEADKTDFFENILISRRIYYNNEIKGQLYQKMKRSKGTLGQLLRLQKVSFDYLEVKGHFY